MTRKISIIIFILIAVGMGMAACDDDPKEETPDPAKDQTATITNLFGEGYEATVKGTLTNAEWNGVADKIETALNGAFSADAGSMPATITKQDEFRAVFGDAVVIIVEKTTDYAKYKVVNGESRTLYLNFNALNAGLQASIIAAVNVMLNETSAVAQVKKQNRVRFGGGMSAI